MAYSAEIAHLVQESDIEIGSGPSEMAFAGAEEVTALEAEYAVACEEVNRTQRVYFAACTAYNNDPSEENDSARSDALNAYTAAE